MGRPFVASLGLPRIGGGRRPQWRNETGELQGEIGGYQNRPPGRRWGRLGLPMMTKQSAVTARDHDAGITQQRFDCMAGRRGLPFVAVEIARSENDLRDVALRRAIAKAVEGSQHTPRPCPLLMRHSRIRRNGSSMNYREQAMNGFEPIKSFNVEWDDCRDRRRAEPGHGLLARQSPPSPQGAKAGFHGPERGQSARRSGQRRWCRLEVTRILKASGDRAMDLPRNRNLQRWRIFSVNTVVSASFADKDSKS